MLVEVHGAVVFREQWLRPDDLTPMVTWHERLDMRPLLGLHGDPVLMQQAVQHMVKGIEARRPVGPSRPTTRLYDVVTQAAHRYDRRRR